MMEYNSTSVGGSWIWLHLHWLFWGIAMFGFVVAIIWIAKYAKKEEIKKIMWATLLIGILGGLLTIPFARSGWYDMMNFHHGGENFNEENFKNMMGGDGDFAKTMLDYMKEELEETSK